MRCIITRLRHVLVTTSDAANATVAIHCSINFAPNNTGSSAVRCAVVVGITTADNSACKRTAGYYCTMEFGISDNALAHGVVHGANQAADIVLSFYCRIACTVLNRTVDLVRKGANFTFLSSITNGYAIFCNTIANSHRKSSTGTGVSVSTKDRPHKARV